MAPRIGFWRALRFGSPSHSEVQMFGSEHGVTVAIEIAQESYALYIGVLTLILALLGHFVSPALHILGFLSLMVFARMGVDLFFLWINTEVGIKRLYLGLALLLAFAYLCYLVFRFVLPL